MGHEFEATDSLVLRQNKAWHGLGRVFEGEMTPTEAQLECFPWSVVQRPLFYKGLDGKQAILDSRKVNLRMHPDYPSGIELGDVSNDYKIIQPGEVADFCEALVGESDTPITVETAGSIRNGARMWFLLRGEAFTVKGKDKDEIVPYVLVSNGYDGGSSFRVTPTTIRVVCSNTLHCVIPRWENGSLTDGSFSIQHRANIKTRVKEARASIDRYSKAVTATKEMIDVMAEKPVNVDDLKNFFATCYSQQYHKIPDVVASTADQRAQDRARDAFGAFMRRFDDEKDVSGITAWNMYNAWSGVVQHDKKARGGDDTDRIERRAQSNLFGLNNRRTQQSIQKAFRFTIAK